MQMVIVILVVAASAMWLGLQGYRYLRPKPGGKLCGGNCCDGDAPPAKTEPRGERVMMISSDDLRARVAARKS